jgi:hypothetical protein
VLKGFKVDRHLLLFFLLLAFRVERKIFFLKKLTFLNKVKIKIDKKYIYFLVVDFLQFLGLLLIFD